MARHEEITFDLVFPIVFYTGTQTWSEPRQLFELVVDGPSHQRFVPGVDALSIDLSALTGELFEHGGAFGDVLRLVQNRTADSRRFRPLLEAALSDLEKLSRRDRRRWLELIIYIHAMIRHERGPRERKRYSQLILNSVDSEPRRNEVIEMIKTDAEVLIEKGKKKGRTEGELNARRSTLLRQLSRRFGEIPQNQRQVIDQSKDKAQLDKWLDRVLDAENLHDVGIE